MGCSPATREGRESRPGEVRLVGRAEKVRHRELAEQQGLLGIDLPAPGPANRSRLGTFIEAAIEEALARRGASPPGIGAASDLNASLSDQLYRARLIGARGLALVFPSLEGITNLAGTLDAEDSAVLRWWLAATSERAVCLYLDVCDRHLGIYGPPIPLHRCLADAVKLALVSAPLTSPEVAASSEAMTLVDPRAPEEAGPSPLAQPSLAQAEATPCTAQGSEEQVESSPAPSLTLSVNSLESSPANAISLPGIDRPPQPVTSSSPEPDREPGDEVLPPSVSATDMAEAEAPRGCGASPVDEAPDASARVPNEPCPSLLPLGSSAHDEWPKWEWELQAARGPKPLSVIERMFAKSYVPLADAVALGIADRSAEATLRAWSESFAKSYADAFDALRIRGKRPTMVLDVPEIAQRLARLHGARAVELVLVDGLRFDLGLRVNEELRRRLGRSAALTERLLLWASLPTTTSVQWSLLGRGPDGLREPCEAAEPHLPVARGRAARLLRRAKSGGREILKLDLVEATLAEPGPTLEERFGELTLEIAELLAAHFAKLQPRTLVMVFGDHGFVLEEKAGRTEPARQGGASPEEVLVPAFAWLVGTVH